MKRPTIALACRITYGIDNWQFKFAAYHLSSHLGDEFIIAHLPGSLMDRINYVRDALVFGASYYPNPVMRLYSEAAYAVNVDGGAEPWEFQFGTELSRPGATGLRGTPFLAINGHLREEHEFGGDITRRPAGCGEANRARSSARAYTTSTARAASTRSSTTRRSRSASGCGTTSDAGFSCQLSGVTFRQLTHR